MILSSTLDSIDLRILMYYSTSTVRLQHTYLVYILGIIPGLYSCEKVPHLFCIITVTTVAPKLSIILLYSTRRYYNFTAVTAGDRPQSACTIILATYSLYTKYNGRPLYAIQI